MKLISLLVCLLLGVLCAQEPGRGVVEFDPNRVIVVDNRNKNYILRGNIPLVEGKFDLAPLKKRITELTKLKPNQYNLKIVTLMNHLTEKESRNLGIEETYFQEHPEAGELISYPILGFIANPETLPEMMVDFFAYFYEKFSYDKLDRFLAQLHDSVLSKNTTVLYFHCSQGIDRTGLISGAYKMKYLNKQLKDIVKENVDIGQRDMQWNTYNGLLWFCEHLQRSRKGIDCGEKGGDYDSNRVFTKAKPKKIGFDDEL